MSKALFLLAFALVTSFMSLSHLDTATGQDCEPGSPGDTLNLCKRLDYLDGIQAPTFKVEQSTDDKGQYVCQGFIEFESTAPLTAHSDIAIAGNRTYSAKGVKHLYHESDDLDEWYLFGEGSYGFSTRYIKARGEKGGGPYWPGAERTYVVEGNKVRANMGPKVYLSSTLPDSVVVFPYLVVSAKFDSEIKSARYYVVSDTWERPAEVADYQLLMTQCLVGITRQLEHDAAVEAARKRAAEDKVQAETAAAEAKNQEELAAIELASAEASLLATEELNAVLLKETILSIRREDTIRAAWQQVALVRMAGLEERTAIWNEAVERWVTEDLKFSSAMEARIQEVQRLQALNAALEQSMADQRRVLIAQLEELEKAEQEVLQARESEETEETEPVSQPGG